MAKLKGSYEVQDKRYKKYIDEKIEEYNNNGKKTIAYFCDTYYPIIDGVIKVLENYASGMSELYNVVVVVPKHKNKVIVPHKKYLVIGANSIYFKFVNYDLAFPDGDNFVKQTLKKLNIDLIHCHSPFNMGIYAMKLAKKLKIPFVMTMHSQYKQDFTRYTKNETIVKSLTKNIVKVFNKSDEVWTMHSMASNTLAGYGYKGKFFYIPNATEFQPPIKPEEMSNYINEKYNIHDEENVFLFVGRLISQKNIFFIVEALKILSDKGYKFKMFFVGNGPDENALKKKITNYNLEDKVILTGKIDNRYELACFFQRSNLFLFPSVYDTSSIVQIEAATFKTPGVFIDGSVTACTLTDNKNAFLCKENTEDFANTIIKAISNKEHLKDVSENAFKDLFVSWDMVISKASERYEFLIEQNKNKFRKLESVKLAIKQNKNS